MLTGDVNIHEIGVESDGRIIFCNTLHSCLATVDPTEPYKPIWKPPFISRLAPEDRCHLNGLAMENGRARYVTCCSTGDALESWRGGRRDAGVLIDIETDAIMADGLSMPHSPRVSGSRSMSRSRDAGRRCAWTRRAASARMSRFCRASRAVWRSSAVSQ